MTNLSSLTWQYLDSAPAGWWRAERGPHAWLVTPSEGAKWTATRVGRGSMVNNSEYLGVRDTRAAAFAVCEQDADRLTVKVAA